MTFGQGHCTSCEAGRRRGAPLIKSGAQGCGVSLPAFHSSNCVRARADPPAQGSDICDRDALEHSSLLSIDGRDLQKEQPSLGRS